MKNFILIIILMLFQHYLPQSCFSQNNGNNILNVDNTLQVRELYNSTSPKPQRQIEKTAQKALGQLDVIPYLNSGYTPDSLVQTVLVSGCLVASNITFTGNNAALGSFNANGSNFALNNGIIISTGNVTNAMGPNQYTNATTQFTTSGDADLNVITGSNSTKDAAVLEFDFIPANNTIEFRYIFASEEYPEWACGTFNDVFAFLLSGPGINGGQGFSNNAKNIALLPNNITPVTINNIHIGGWNQGNSEISHNPLTCPNMNSQYYVSNAGSTSIEYDGMTTILTAQWSVIPCQTYHIKFAIADVADRKWDSGVFIEGASFTSNPVTMYNFDMNGNPTNEVFEDCNYNFVFSRNNLDNSSPLTIYYTITGTADSLDYTFPFDSVTIPAGIDSLIVPYSIISDGIPEGTETLTLSIGNGCPCSANDIVKTLTLNDALSLTTNYNGITCNNFNNGIIIANAIGGSGTYQYSINGGSLQVSNTFTNLVPGNYIVTVNDGASCSTASDTIILVDPPILNLNASITTNILCYNGSDAIITATGNGGSGGYIYNLNGVTNQASGVFNNLVSGNYIISVIDTNGCLKQDTLIITQPSQLSSSIIISNDASCNRFFDGSVTVSASGGTSGYTFLWSNGSILPNNNYLSADTYFVTITDNNGCTVTDSIVIDEPALLTATITNINNASCNGSNDGSATVIAGGGTAPYSYLWSTGDTSTTVTGLSSGTYNVTVTDDHGCIISATVIIDEPLLIIPNISVISQVNCFSGSNGSVSISSTGGIPSYMYNWSNGSTQSTLTGLSEGTYFVTITDNVGCTVSTSVTVNQPPLLTTSINITNISCFNQNNGSATASTSGGTTPYNYLWSTGNTSNTINNLAVGTYSVTVTDLNGCTTSATIIITEPITLTTSIIPSTNIDCFAGSNGSTTVVPNGGTSPYTYNWSNGTSNGTATGLVTGTYSVTVTDNNGCTATNSVVINQPPQLTLNITSAINVSCNGSANGSVTVIANGGVLPYFYNWSDGSQTTTISILTTGIYAVTVTDNNGCTAMSSVTITQPNILLASITSNNVACYTGINGSATVLASGGTPTYNYQWSTGSNSNTISNLPGGTYIVTVTDLNGCTATSSVNITQPTILTTSITPTTNLSCFAGSNGSATVVPNGGTSPYNYNWSNGSNNGTTSGLVTGTYTVTVTDNNGCTATNSVFINQPPQLITNISSTTNISCNGSSNGSVTVYANGGVPAYSYVWSNGSNNTTISNLSAGTYIVTITDNNACTATNSVTITQPNILNVTITSNNVNCFGGSNGSATTNPSGGTPNYSYIWSTGDNTQTINNLIPGIYSVTVTDNNGCSASNTVNLIQPPVNINISSTTSDISCFGANDGSVQIFVSGNTGPYIYTWSNNATNDTINGLSAGNYSVTVTDSYGCVLSTSVVINEPLALTANTNIINQVSCNAGSNGMVEIIVSGGTQPYSYQWSNGSLSSVISGLTAGNYNVTVSDYNGCTATNFAAITEPSPFNSSIIAFNDVSCFNGSNGSAMVSGSGGVIPYSYLWSNGTITNLNNNIVAGSYSVTVIDANGCITNSSVIISEPTPINAVITVNSHVSCFNGNDGLVTVNVSGGVGPYSYTWSNGSIFPTVNNITAGQYYLTVTDQNNCQAFESVIITQPSQSIFITVTSTDVSCATGSNGSANAMVGGSTGPYTYLWSNSITIPSISNLTSGIYSLTVTDAMGCFLTSQVTINEPLVIALQVTSTNVSCFNGNNGSASVSVAGGTSPYTYTWSNGIAGQALSNIVAGSYSVTVTDQHGCYDSISAVISQPALLTATTSVTNVSCYGGNNGAATVVVSGGTMPYYYYWSNAANTSMAGGLIAGNYTVTVTDGNLCTVTGSVVITQPSQLTSQIISFADATCFGYNNGSATVLASGGSLPYEYQWDINGDTTATSNSLGAGLHQVVITDNNGCITTSSVNISQPTIVSITTSGNETLCMGNSTTISASAAGGTAPYTYTWNPAAGNTNSLLVVVYDSMNYLVYATDANGCTSNTGSIILTTNPILKSSISANSSICIGESTILNLIISGGMGPYSYTWDNGLGNQPSPITVSPTSTTTYVVTVSDACNSTPVINSFTVTVHPLPVANIIVDNVKGCGSLSANFFDSNYMNNNTYLWNFEDPQSGANNYSTETNPNHIYNHIGIFDLLLTVTTEFGCTSVFNYPQLISVFDIPIAAFDLDNLMISLDNPTLRCKDQSIGASSWLWDFGDPSSESLNTSTYRNPYHEYTEMGNYTIWQYVENVHGCKDSTSKEIQVLDYITFFVPNAFTPNGDGVNEEFMIQGTGLLAEGFRILIYDRWGGLVFENNDIMAAWNGKGRNGNKVCPNGVYTWMVSAKDELGGQINKTGSVTLIH